MSDIFISYSRSDRATAQKLANALQRENWSVWWDPEIPPGKVFDEVIDQALEEAKCVIVLWSKASVKSTWVKAEAAEGNRRGILLPALIEDDAKVPLEFRYTQASQLADWQGQSGHAQFVALRAAVSELLGRTAESMAADAIYFDPETRLMWTTQDNGDYIDWDHATEYAEQLRLGGFSDWRLPTLDELEKLYDPQNPAKCKIRELFRLSNDMMWSSNKESSFNAWYFSFSNGKRLHFPTYVSVDFRALCVRRSGE